MKCKFRKSDGRYNFVEGNTNAGRVQCTVCGRVYPKPSKRLIPFPDNKEFVAMGRCPGSPEALKAQGEKKPCGACNESLLARAAKAYQSMLDNFAKVLAKANPELHAAVLEELNKMVEPDIARLQLLAVKEALAEGKEYDATLAGTAIESGREGDGEGAGDPGPEAITAAAARASDTSTV